MTESVLTLDRSAGAPRRARARMRQLEPRLGPARTEDAALLVSELVTNAIKYGTQDGEIRLIIAENDTRMRVTVHDTGAGALPAMRPVTDRPDQAGGHGLRLVDIVADRWGVERGSIRVWFELDL